MIPYILRAAVMLTACFLFYKLFLQKATFYGLNRWTLLSCLVLSFALPLLPAPKLLTFSFLDPVSPPTANVPATHPTKTFNASTTPDDIALIPVTAAITPTTTPITPATTAPAAVAITPATAASAPSHHPTPPSHPIRALLLQGLQLLPYLYIFGLLVFGLKFILQILVLCYQAFARPVSRDGRYRIVQTKGHRGPCTFGHTIFINPDLYDRETYQQILVHEKIHVSGGHTLDILLAELAVVFQWFNPFTWLYRREVENNLEFLTDRSVLEHPDIERSAYQLSLLRVSAPHLPFSITNNYNQSLLKRRIVMMNSQHSARHTIWRYFVLLPVLTLLVCALNKKTALGQPVATTTGTSISRMIADTVKYPLKDTDVTTVAIQATTSIRHAITATTATTSITPATTITATTAPITAADPIAATSITAATADPVTIAATVADTTPLHFSGGNFELRKGSWFLTADSNDLEFILRSQDGENSWQSDFTVKKSEINPYPGQGSVEFNLVREAGTMSFKGTFDGEQGFGRFQFEPDQSYYDAMEKMGVEDLDNGRQHSFFMLNIKKEFISMLVRNGYTPIEEHDIISLAALKVDESFLKYWKNSGIEGATEVHNLFTLKRLHIDPDYVDDLRKAGYTQLSVHQLISLKIQHIDGNYIRSMSSGAANPISPENLVSYKMMHIDSGYLLSLQKVGYNHLDRSEVWMLFRSHVTADYIKGFQDAGFSDIPASTLSLLKQQNVSPELAKSFRTLGYTDISLNRLVGLQHSGITPEFINAFHKIGYDNIPLNQLLLLKSSGVDADYVARMKEKGLNSKDLNKYILLKRDFN